MPLFISTNLSFLSTAMNSSFAVKPNLGFTSARLPGCYNSAPPLFLRVNIRSIRFEDTFHGGPLLRRQQHHNVPCVFYKGWGEKEPFSLRNLRMTTEQVCAKTPSKISTYEILGPEMILLNNYVSLKDQVDVVYTCDKLGVGPEGFHEPYFLEEEDYRIPMFFGQGWGPRIPPVPHQLITLAARAVEDARAHLGELPSMCPNSCLVCFYPLSCGQIGLHQDYDDSDRESPVVSIFIGETAEFMYRFYGDKSYKTVLLQSGDVLIYGGRSRHIFHGVKKIFQGMPLPLLQETGIKSGCLNLTLKQF